MDNYEVDTQGASPQIACGRGSINDQAARVHEVCGDYRLRPYGLAGRGEFLFLHSFKFASMLLGSPHFVKVFPSFFLKFFLFLLRNHAS